MEEVDLGDRAVKKPTYISEKINQVGGVKDANSTKFMEFKDCFAWDYDEMSGLSRYLVELKLEIRPDKRQVKHTA